MRRLLAVALALGVAAALIVAALYATAPAALRVKAGERAPALKLPPLFGGAPVSLPLEREPTLLVLIDQRFPNAAFRLADLERLHRRYLARGLRVVVVSLDAEDGPVRLAAEKAVVTFPLLRDPGGAAVRDTYGGPTGFTAYLISPAGVVDAVYREPFDWRQPEVRERLEAHIAPAPPGW